MEVILLHKLIQAFCKRVKLFVQGLMLAHRSFTPWVLHICLCLSVLIRTLLGEPCVLYQNIDKCMVPTGSRYLLPRPQNVIKHRRVKTSCAVLVFFLMRNGIIFFGGCVVVGCNHCRAEFIPC